MLRLFHLLLIDPRLARARLRCAAILYLAILVLGSVPGARADIGRLASGVVLHSLAYAGLTVLVFGGIIASPARRAAGSILTIAVMGALDECVQSWFPYRHAALGDWLVDCSAALLSAGVLALLWQWLSAAVVRHAPAQSD